MEQPNLSEEQNTHFQRYYMNRVQAIANILDPNSLFAEWGRGPCVQSENVNFASG